MVENEFQTSTFANNLKKNNKINVFHISPVY